MHQEELYSIGDAAHRSGLSVSTVRFYAEAGVIEPITETSAALSGGRSDEEYRARLAVAFEQAETFMGQADGPYQAEDADFARTHGRYLSLVAVINGGPPQEEDPVPYISWLVAALRAESASA